MKDHKCETCKHYFLFNYFVKTKNIAGICLKSKLQISESIKDCTHFKPIKT